MFSGGVESVFEPGIKSQTRPDGISQTDRTRGPVFQDDLDVRHDRIDQIKPVPESDFFKIFVPGQQPVEGIIFDRSDPDSDLVVAVCDRFSQNRFFSQRKRFSQVQQLVVRDCACPKPTTKSPRNIFFFPFSISRGAISCG